MENKNIRNVVFIIIGVLLLAVFLKILPYIILGGISVYIVVKLYKYIKFKIQNRKKFSSFDFSRQENIENSNVDSNFDISNAIEVDYKDVEW